MQGNEDRWERERIDGRGRGSIDMFGVGCPYTIWPMTADGCQVRLGCCPRLQNFWITAARVESKCTNEDCPCTHSSHAENTYVRHRLWVFWNAPAVLSRYPCSWGLYVHVHTSIRPTTSNMRTRRSTLTPCGCMETAPAV